MLKARFKVHAHYHHNRSVTVNIIFATPILLNSVFFLTEVSYGFIVHSVSLLSDDVHNFGDVLGLLMSWSASILIKKRATKRYSYGYKKLTILITQEYTHTTICFNPHVNRL